MLNKLKDSGSCSKIIPSQKLTHSYDYINSKNFDYEEPTGRLPDHPPSEGSIEKKYSIISDGSHINTSFDPSITFNMVSNVLRIPIAVTAFSSLSSPSNSWINVTACVNTNSNAVHHFEMIRVPCKLEGTFIGSLKGRIYVDAFPPPPTFSPFFKIISMGFHSIQKYYHRIIVRVPINLRKIFFNLWFLN